MNEGDIHQPNDKLFRTTFGIPENAAAFLQTTLPSEVSAAIDWSNLKPEPGTFVDSKFRTSQTDLLFSAPLGEEEGWIYLLFEHQSSHDRHLHLRLLRYLVRIWEKLAESRPASQKLPVVLPVILCQNAEPWAMVPRFSSLLGIPGGLTAELAPFVPDFSPIVIQLANLPDEAIPGNPACIFVLRVMKAERSGEFFNEHVWDEDLILRVPEPILHLVLTYLLARDVDKTAFFAKLESLPDKQIRENAMTLAQQLRQEGRQEGLQEGRMESILDLLQIRFGHVPEGLRKAILAVHDESALKELQRSAIQCSSLEEFSRFL
jgi:predicted transposase YdaD